MSLHSIIAAEGLTAAGELLPAEFVAKIEHGFIAAKTLRVYTDLLNGQHDDVYIIGGEHYKARPYPGSPLRGRGPWAGILDHYSLVGKWLIVANSWHSEKLEEATAKGESTSPWQKTRGKWSYVSTKTPVGYGDTIFMVNSNKGPPKVWHKIFLEAR